MVNQWTDIILDEDQCVENCPAWGEIALPEDPECCPVNELGQICGIYLDPCCLNPIPVVYNPGRILEWAAASIDNSDTSGEKVKYLVVEGSKGAPDDTITELPKGKSKVTKRTYTIEIEIKCDTEDVIVTVPESGGSLQSYGSIDNFMRRVQKGEVNFCFWYETLGGYFYGDQAGITPTLINAFPVHENDKDSVRTWNLTISWEALCDPIRTLNPLA